MEIEGADGSKLALKFGSTAVLGRGSGFNTTDGTVSRRHVILKLEAPAVNNGETQEEPRVSFEVTGKNPVWVRNQTNGKLKVFKKSEKGEVEDGDWLCISGRIPVWFAVKKSDEENGNEEEERDLGRESGATESLDIDGIDPIKEFGFLVMGHEFDQYSNQRMCNVKNWDWFLEESGKGKDSDDEAVEKRGRGVKGRKRRKGDDDDDEWTGESEDDKEVIAKERKVRRVAYSTRLKDRDKSKKGGGKSRSSVQKKTVIATEEDDLDEDDETLGGFIVEDEDDEELEEESELDEEEEEDFEDEDEENYDDD